MLLTFLAGAELEPEVLKLKWREAASLGSVSFLVPFFLCAAMAHYLLGWGVMPSWLAGVALGGTSVAVVYTEMMQHGLNGTDFGKVLLGACFVTDLGNVIALGLIFSPFTFRTVLFIVLTVAGSIALLRFTPLFSADLAASLPNSRPNSCFLPCSRWDRSPPGPIARPCFPPMPSAWCSPAPSAGITP